MKTNLLQKCIVTIAEEAYQDYAHYPCQLNEHYLNVTIRNICLRHDIDLDKVINLFKTVNTKMDIAYEPIIQRY